jgi:hypothetical protein
MPVDELRELNCLVEGDSTGFHVIVPIGNRVSHLREMVWEERKNGAFRNIDSTDLALMKVRGRK